MGSGSPAISAENPGLGKFLFAAVFPVCLMLVVIAGAELFTGNTSVIMPSCLSGAAKWKNLFRNWGVVYIGNFAGSVFVALFLAFWSGLVNVNSAAALPQALGAASVKLAEAKVAIPFGQAILRGIACNWLVCLAVWMSIGADDIAGKILAIWFPIMALSRSAPSTRSPTCSLFRWACSTALM